MIDKLHVSGRPLRTSIMNAIIRRGAREAHRTLAFRMALKLAGDLRSKIYQQVFEHEPLSIRYLNRKIRRGLDERILIATGSYVNNIRVRKDERGRYVISPGDHTTQNGVPFTTLGAWLEFGTLNEDGTQKMPPRPHWRPIWRQFLSNREEWRKQILEKVAPEISLELKRAIEQQRRVKSTRR